MNSFDLDTPLLKLPTKNGTYNWTIRSAVQNVAVFGGIGSGKTSAIGRKLALKYLHAGFGGIVLCAKNDEANLWRKYCEEAGRLDDLIVVEESGKNYFNVLDYEFRNSPSQRVATDNIVEVLTTIIKSGEERSGGKSDDRFWSDALNLTLYNVCDLLNLAHGRITIKDMYELMSNIPAEHELPNDHEDETIQKEKEEKLEENVFVRTYNLAQEKVELLVKEWRERNPQFTVKNSDEYAELVSFHVPEARTLKNVHDFFNNKYIKLNDKTRSIIDFSFSSFLNRLYRDPIYSVFSQYESNFSPDDCNNGKIIVLDFPVKRYQRAGKDIQTMIKYVFQRAMERRTIHDDTRPLFIWADEAQNFLHELDSEFLSTSRSSRIANIYLSQNISNFYANMGGSKAEHKVKSLLGTLSTKFFLANADVDTNNYASQLCGEAFFYTPSENENFSNESFGFGQGKNFQVMRAVRPEEFIKLKCGGPDNNHDVEAYMHVQGNPLSGDKNYLKVVFNQNN